MIMIVCHINKQITLPPPDPTDIFATQILGGHMTSRNQGLSSTKKGGGEERPWQQGWHGGKQKLKAIIISIYNDY